MRVRPTLLVLWRRHVPETKERFTLECYGMGSINDLPRITGYYAGDKTRTLFPSSSEVAALVVMPHPLPTRPYSLPGIFTWVRGPLVYVRVQPNLLVLWRGHGPETKERYT